MWLVRAAEIRTFRFVFVNSRYEQYQSIGLKALVELICGEICSAMSSYRQVRVDILVGKTELKTVEANN